MHTQPHRGFSAVSNVAVGHFWEEDRKLVFWQSLELLLFNSFVLAESGVAAFQLI